MSNFALDLRKFAKKAGNNAESAIRKIILSVDYGVIDISPRDKGRFANNWNVSINSIDKSTTEETDKSGELAKARAKSVMLSFKLGDTAYISNSLPYAQRLEDGYSKQAPAGMVKVTLVQYQSFVKKAVKSL